MQYSTLNKKNVDIYFNSRGPIIARSLSNHKSFMDAPHVIYGCPLVPALLAGGERHGGAERVEHGGVVHHEVDGAVERRRGRVPDPPGQRQAKARGHRRQPELGFITVETNLLLIS